MLRELMAELEAQNTRGRLRAQLRPAAAPAASSAAFSLSCARAFGRDLTGVSRTAGFSIEPGVAEEACDPIGRQRADPEPMLDPLGL